MNNSNEASGQKNELNKKCYWAGPLQCLFRREDGIVRLGAGLAGPHRALILPGVAREAQLEPKSEPRPTTAGLRRPYKTEGAVPSPPQISIVSSRKLE